MLDAGLLGGVGDVLPWMSSASDTVTPQAGVVTRRTESPPWMAFSRESLEFISAHSSSGVSIDDDIGGSIDWRHRINSLLQKGLSLCLRGIPGNTTDLELFG